MNKARCCEKVAVLFHTLPIFVVLLSSSQVRKKRLADLNIYCPNRHFDYRISISTETEVPDKPQGRLLFERHKERVSYRHEIFSFDLTTVDTVRSLLPPVLSHQPTTTTKIRDSQRKVTYEMEIEIADMKRLFHERDRLHHGAPNNFSRIIQGMPFVITFCLIS